MSEWIVLSVIIFAWLWMCQGYNGKSFMHQVMEALLTMAPVLIIVVIIAASAQ